MKCYRAILFDLDGTVLDYDTGAFQALRHTLTECGIGENPEHVYARYHEINQKLWEEMESGRVSVDDVRVLRFERLFCAYHWPVNDIRTVSELYLTYLAHQGQTLPGALDVLETLKKRYRLGAITNGIAFVQRSRIRYAGLEGTFDPLLISEEIHAAKPDPKIFDIALAKCGCRADEVLYVGDSITSDMAGAAASGIDFCWMNPTGQLRPETYKAVIEIRRLEELPPYLLYE